MTLRPKYSLKLFLLIATAVTVFLGYSQIRRQNILDMCAELRKDGYVIKAPNELQDSLWQRKPYVGFISVYGETETLEGTMKQTDEGTVRGWTRDRQEIARMKRLGVVSYTEPGHVVVKTSDQPE